ncbi:MAG TPA: hypothetical protein VIY68_08110 [Steroidobacteraceae bacterium]
MAQSYSAGRYVARGLGLFFGAWIIFNTHKESDSTDVPSFDANQSCLEKRVVTDAPAAPLNRPSAGECVVQSVTVISKNYRTGMGGGSGHGTAYTITVQMPWGGQHSFDLRGGRPAYDAIPVGRPINTLLYGPRVAFVAVDGRAVSTTDDPDVDRLVKWMRWIGAGLLLGLGMYSFYRAMRSGPA